MRPLLFLAALAAAAALPSVARADDSARSGVVLDVPLVDLPYNARGGLRWPSMTQSLALSGDFYQVFHYGVGQAIDPYEGEWWRRLLGRAVISAGDLLVTGLPPALTWQHEEGHRAVLGTQKISSANGVYHFKPFSSTTSVDKVKDEDLAAFKARDPAGFVRMSTAGLESSLELVTSLEKTQLFYSTRAWHGFLFWQTYATNTAYLGACASKSIDKDIADIEAKEGADVANRDFTGADCTGWVYDLFRPDEPYGARGAHPSGVGVRRYRRQADLTSAEKSHLNRQFYLSFLNFLDPALVGFDWFTMKIGPRQEPLRWSAHVRHTPAPFGQSINLEVFGQYRAFNGFFGVLGGMNEGHFFPGVNAELHRFPMDLVIGLPVTVSARASAWVQPTDLRFHGSSYAPGALGSLRLAYGVEQAFEPYVEVEGKSAGWVPGNTWLRPTFSARVGLVSALFN